MHPGPRSFMGNVVALVVVSVLVGGCAQATGSATSAAVVTAAAVTAAPSPTESASASPSASPAVTASPSAAPSSAAITPAPSPSPDDVATPPPSQGTGWSGITWRKLAADDPLAQIQSVTDWHGGYIARGFPVSGDPNAVHTPVWTSTDGLSWDPLRPEVFGPSAIVVGIAATADGLVALTLESVPLLSDEDIGQLTVSGPIRSWTSSNGTTWIGHPGPDVSLSEEMFDPTFDVDWLQASTAARLLLTARTRPPFVSTDGVVWKRQSTSGLPSDFELDRIRAFGTGFLAVADHAIASSPDGRAWTARVLPIGCSADEGVVVGPSGLIATGFLDDIGGHQVAPWAWCSSRDGLTWHRLPDLSPLGRMSGTPAQECRDNCADGILVGNAQRMVAYRGWGDQVGWTSLDGRTWRPLTFKGHPERTAGWLSDRCTQNIVLMPMGIRCPTNDDAVWFGEARP